MKELDILGAFLVGLAGTGHCLGMCGPVASILTINLKQNTALKQIPSLLLYNLARLCSYMLMGGTMAISSAFLAKLISIEQGLNLLRVLAALLIIVTGLHLIHSQRLITQLETLGLPIWRIIKPLAQHFIPLRSPWHAIPFGFLWGWLPCGLVYTMLSWSLSAGSFINGALIMGAFGLGTLFPMLALGLVGEKLRNTMASRKLKLITGIALIGYGFYSFSSIFGFFS